MSNETRKVETEELDINELESVTGGFLRPTWPGQIPPPPIWI
jgi:bacteriocin-like protein